MPIRSYVEKGVVFTPQSLSSMGKALEETTKILGMEGEEQRQAVARFVIRLAGEDDSLDAMALRDRAVEALCVRPLPAPMRHSAVKRPGAIVALGRLDGCQRLSVQA
jgi:hypothetical protein